MTVLQALNGYYERLAARGEVPPFGYSRERISYAVVVSPDGEPLEVLPLLDTSGKKPQPQPIAVPRAVKRAFGIAANFLWDKTSYVLGVSARDSKRIAGEHTAFKALHAEALSVSDDEGLRALRLFLESWRPERFAPPLFPEEMRDANLVFRLDGERGFVHERPAAEALVARRAAEAEGATGLCLVTGERAPIARLHPSVKGVQGAQTSGGSLVSFNLDAFESYGKRQGDNAPVSERAAFAYGTALNALLRWNSGRRLRIGDATAVFWAEAAQHGEANAAATEDLFATIVEPPSDEEEAAKVADLMRDVAAGRKLRDAHPGVCEDTRFYILGLSPNAARLSLRFWLVDEIGGFARRLAEHWRDLRIEPPPWRTPPSIRCLLFQTAPQGKDENIPPLLGGTLARAVLTGGRYPQALLATTIMRMRADRDVNGLRAAICKACLARDHRLGIEQEDVPVALNPEEPNPAYRLGRLFAVYESVQRAALGRINATIKDRYFGAASAAPASIFPLLVRNSAHHLSGMRKGDKAGLAVWFEREIDQILSGLDSAFPPSLRLADQGRFALGYHHQRAHWRSDAPAEAQNSNPEDDDDEA